MSNNITFKSGNLFESQMQTFTNTINTVGVMGAGIAKQFKDRFPVMFEDYKQRCQQQEVETGKPYLWKPADAEIAWVLNFPTKQHWRGKSEIEWIEEGLDYLLQHYRQWGIQSLAVPALGCSLGGLKWEQVKPVMERYLSQMDIPVEIYEPLPEIKKPKQNQNRKAKSKASSQRKLF